MLASGSIGWGYGLGKYVYAPLQRFLPRVMALLMTFVISGGLHDLATVIVKGSTEFLFTIWFTLMGALVIVGRAVGLDFSHHPWATRAGINLAYVFVCLAGALVIKPIFAAG